MDLSGDPGPADRISRPIVLGLLALDGVLCAVIAALLLPSYVGNIPFPISAAVAGIVNTALVWAALEWTSSYRVAALPLWTWLITIAGLTLGGPGGDVVFAANGVSSYGLLLLIAFGALPPVVLLWRRGRAGRHT